MKQDYNIIFDLDGTLVHTAPALTKAANNLLNELSLPSINTKLYSTFIGGGITKQVERLLNFYKELDPTNTFNPGIGKTSKLKDWK